MRAILGVAIATLGCAQVCRSVVEGREVPCPLSRGDLHQVLSWVASEVARRHQPFCWRHSYVKVLGKCRSGYGHIWPVCWEKCTSGRKGCAMGCAASGGDCRRETLDMVTESLVFGANIVTLGRASTASQAAKLVRLKGLAKGGRRSARRPSRSVDVPDELQVATDDWVKEYVSNFKAMTTPEVDSELRRHFDGDALLWIQEQYALNQLALLMEAEGDQSFRTTLADIAAFDPTGVAGVVEAFSQPMCKAPRRFPAVTVLPHQQNTSPPADTLGGHPEGGEGGHTGRPIE